MVWQSLAGHYSPYPEQGKCQLSELLFIQPSLNPPLPFLHMEEGSRSFAVWWRCVLTQRGDEDGILIGLIELMVLSPLVGEECQASLWLCASWFAFCYTRALIWTLPLSVSDSYCYLPSSSLPPFLDTVSFYSSLSLPVRYIKAALLLHFCRKRPLFIVLLIL